MHCLGNEQLRPSTEEPRPIWKSSGLVVFKSDGLKLVLPDEASVKPVMEHPSKIIRLEQPPKFKGLLI